MSILIENDPINGMFYPIMEGDKMKVIVKDNTGASASYGSIDKILQIGEEVEVIYQDGGCFKVKKENGEFYTLNVNRFELNK